MRNSIIDKDLLTGEYYDFIKLTKDEFTNKHIDNLTGGIVYFASAVSEKFNDEINLGIQLNEDRFIFITELTKDNPVSLWHTLEDAEKDFLQCI